MFVSSETTLIEWFIFPFVVVLLSTIVLIATILILINNTLKTIPSYNIWYELHYDEDSLRYKLWKAVGYIERLKK